MKDFRKVSFQDLDQLVTKASLWYSRIFSMEITQANEKGVQPTIAMIGVGISFDYYITMLALLRLHIRILLLSNKNPLVAHQHLLGKCDALGCIVDEANADIIGQEEGFLQKPVPLVSIDGLQKESSTDHGNIDVDNLGFKVDDEWKLPSVIIHSSGTTGMPKPIVHTNGSVCIIARHYRLYRDFYIENFQMCAPL
jgi:acyl-coenzyme A synthetase/AMP-(fatty) acid ligase